MIPSPSPIADFSSPSGQQFFDNLLREWETRIHRWAIHYCLTLNDLDDFRQIGRLALYRAAKTFDGNRSSFNTYSTKLIQNAMRDARRASRRILRRERTCSTDEGSARLVDHEVVTYGDALIDADDAESMIRWRAALNDRNRQILNAVCVDDYSVTAVASQFGLSTARISQIMHGLRRSLLRVA